MLPVISQSQTQLLLTRYKKKLLARISIKTFNSNITNIQGTKNVILPHLPLPPHSVSPREVERLSMTVNYIIFIYSSLF